MMVSGLGPQKFVEAPNFVALDHDRKPCPIHTLMGQTSFLLGFIDNVWEAVSIRRIMWMQRHAPKLEMYGVNTALICHDDCHTLYDFHISSPESLPFTLLSDADSVIHDSYNLQDRVGLVLINAHMIVQQTWLISPDRVWPRMHELVSAIQSLEITSVA